MGVETFEAGLGFDQFPVAILGAVIERERPSELLRDVPESLFQHLGGRQSALVPQFGDENESGLPLQCRIDPRLVIYGLYGVALPVADPPSFAHNLRTEIDRNTLWLKDPLTPARSFGNAPFSSSAETRAEVNTPRSRFSVMDRSVNELVDRFVRDLLTKIYPKASRDLFRRPALFEMSYDIRADPVVL